MLLVLQSQWVGYATGGKEEVVADNSMTGRIDCSTEGLNKIKHACTLLHVRTGKKQQ